MAEGEVTIRIPSEDQIRVKALGRLMKEQANGKELRVELIAGLRSAVSPAQDAVKSTLRAWPHGGATTANPAMGSYLASRVRTQVRLSGRRTGVAVRIPTTPQLRGFRKAATALNSANGWRHKVFGHDVWVQQTSPIPNFFDDTLMKAKDACRTAIIVALERMERRLHE